MSFWKRLFGKGCDRGALAPPVGLAQRYLKKYQQFQAILAESEAAGAIMAQLQHRLAKPENLDLPQFQEQCADLLGHMRQALDLLLEFCRQKPDELLAAFAELAARFQEILSLAEASGQDTLELVQDQLRPLLFSRQQAEPSQGSSPLAASASVPDLLAGITEHRLQEMFCLSLRSQVSKKQAVSLVTGRLVPILVIDAGGGLSSTSVTVNLDDVASVPYKAFLDGMLSIPWPKARPLDMKGFISVVGVTSTTPRAEDQLQKISFALLAREYMNFSLCLGYHASTIEAYVSPQPPCNYLRFHYQGGAASVERRVRRLRLIRGILTRLGFEVSITGDLLDARKTGDEEAACLKLLEILGRLEVFTKQMDMVLSDDEVVLGYIEDFLANHC